VAAIISGESWVWFLTFICLGVGVVVGSYYYQLAIGVRALLRQQRVLLEKMLRLKTKPWLSVSEQLMQLLGKVIEKWFLRSKGKSNDKD
jgi:hypothetical protein